MRIDAKIVCPSWIFRRSSLRPDENIVIAVLDAHQRCLPNRTCLIAPAKSRSYRYEPNIENARVLLAPAFDQLVAVGLIAPNFENVLQLLVRERMQVWPYLVVLAVAFILFQPLHNRIVGMHWCA